uniref:Uncharacterized protein n=1 Tax=Arundo donax TaxID=35708 RepID=A0A0A9HD62_ARUDO
MASGSGSSPSPFISQSSSNVNVSGAADSASSSDGNEAGAIDPRYPLVFVHSIRNRLTPIRAEELVFVHTNI